MSSILTPPHLFVCLALGLGMSACTPPEDSDIPDLPTDDTPEPEDTGPFEFPEDTADTSVQDQVPENWLYLYQEGELNLSPGGGPYTALTGSFEVLELIDFELPAEDTDTDTDTDTDPPWADLEDSPLVCQVAYTLIGSPSESSPCAGCSWAMDVEFRVAAGDPEPCYDPDLPADGDVRTFGWNDSSGQLLYNFQGTGVWFPWFPGSASSDQVAFNWNARLAVSVEEEDDQ